MTVSPALAGLCSRPGSTRSVAVLRVCLVAVVWADKAPTLTVFRLHQLGVEPAIALPLIAVFYAGTILLFIGLWSRTAAAICGLCGGFMIFYLGGYREIALFNYQYTTLLFTAVLLLSLTPCGRSYSVDRLLRARACERAGRPPPPEEGDLWALSVFRILVSSVYFWAAYDKLAHDHYLSGFAFAYNLTFAISPSDALDLPGLAALAQVLGIATVTTEAFLAVALWSRRLRGVAFAVGFAFHGAIHALIPMAFFSYLMAALYIVFLPPGSVHRSMDRLRSNGGVA